MMKEHVKKTILLVDNLPEKIDIISGALRQDYKVKAALSGKDGLAVALQQPSPDLILLDIEMPDLDGCQVCQNLQAEAVVKGTPIVFLSDKESLDERLRAYEAGGHDYIVMPCDGNRLLAKLALILEQETQEQSCSSLAQSSQALSNNPNTGDAVDFIANFSVTLLDSQSYEDVASKLLPLLTDLNVDARLLLRSEQKDFFFSTEGVCTPLEMQILTLLKGGGGVAKVRQLTQFNTKYISVFVKKMPEGRKQQERIEKQLFTLLRLANACVTTLDLSAKYNQQQRLLTAQIEPHFLFNTISNVVGLVGRDSVRAKQTLLNLSILLRASLRLTSERQITLNEELGVVRAYLEIQAMRKDGRLRYELLPADLWDEEAVKYQTLGGWLIPTMLIQPLVENAITHGIDPFENGGTVQIEVSVEECMLHIKVSDTAADINADVLASRCHGTGLSNLNSRLAALYGGAARLTVSANTPSGVVAILSIPPLPSGNDIDR